MWPFATEAEALNDALRLSRAMTYKWAATGLNVGGGKCVVIGDPKRDKSEAPLRSLGRSIQRLHGLFLTGTDVDTTLQDMDIMRQESSDVVATSETAGGPGNSAPATAFGVVQGMRACLKATYGSPDLYGRHIAVQGVGEVGQAVVEQLLQAGATVTITDVDQQKLAQLAAQYGVHTVSPQVIYSLPADVYCPCALGAVLNDETIPTLQCKVVCGSANNQLAEERHGDQLEQRGIIYAPDYIVNAGGALFNVDSLNPNGFQRARAQAAVAHIYETMNHLLALAHEQHIPTYRAADVLAEQRIAQAKQHTPGGFHDWRR